MHMQISYRKPIQTNFRARIFAKQSKVAAFCKISYSICFVVARTAKDMYTVALKGPRMLLTAPSDPEFPYLAPAGQPNFDLF